MERQAIESKMLKSIGYDPATQTLEVEFNKGDVYQYLNVPPETFAKFTASDSKGRFYLDFVRACFECKRIPKEEPDAEVTTEKLEKSITQAQDRKKAAPDKGTRKKSRARK
jgi:hypothetical protein